MYHNRLPALLPLSAVVFLACCSLAVAGPLNNFNLIALGNVTGTSEVEGRAYVGGDISGNAKNFVVMNQGLSSPVNTPGLAVSDGLIVNGQILGTVNVNNGANVRVATADASAIVNTNGGGSLTYNDAGVATIAAAVNNAVLQADSYFSNLTADSTINSSDANNLVFNATPGPDGVAVFDMPSSYLTSRNGTFDLTGDLNAELYLIRVNGVSLAAGNGLNPNSNEFNSPAFQERIVFYFAEASTLNLGGIGGAVVAPRANLSFTSPLEGTVVANNVALNSEIHLPTLKPEIPEPSSLVLLCVSLLVTIRRRRQ